MKRNIDAENKIKIQELIEEIHQLKIEKENKIEKEVQTKFSPVHKPNSFLISEYAVNDRDVVTPKKKEVVDIIEEKTSRIEDLLISNNDDKQSVSIISNGSVTQKAAFQNNTIKTELIGNKVMFDIHKSMIPQNYSYMDDEF